MTNIGRHRFRPALVPTLVTLLLFPILLSLGFWQLDRAEQKRLLLEKQNSRRNDRPIQLRENNYSFEDLRFRRVIVRGVYDREHQLLIDNQIVKGKAGFFVLTPLHIQNSQHVVLVNRGWVPLGRDRMNLPDIKIVQKEVTVTGVMDNFPQVGIKLKGAEVPTEGWPAIVQIVEVSTLSKRLGYSLLPLQILLDQDSGQGYYRHWQFSTRMSPEKHQAYALQWFALAATLTILYLWYSTKPR